jgi:hypothetical protein
MFSGDDYGDARQRYLHEQFNPWIAGGKQGTVPEWGEYKVEGDLGKDAARGYNLTSSAQDDLMMKILLQLMRGDPKAETRFRDYKAPEAARVQGDPLVTEAQSLVGRY